MLLKTTVIWMVATAIALTTSLTFAAKWVPITGEELKEVYSDKTYKGKTKKGTPFTGHYCADGQGVIIIRGEKKPRTWELKDDDKICVTTSKGSVSCFNFVRNSKEPNKIKGKQIDKKAEYELTLQEGKPEICN